MVRGSLGELAAWAVDGARGEITVVLAAADPAAAEAADLVGEVEQLVADGERLKDACAVVAEAHGASRRELYEAVLAARRE